MKLNRCPCGEIPTELCIDGDRRKWSYVSGNCCGEWSVEFRSQYYQNNDPELMEYATKAWNSAKRKETDENLLGEENAKFYEYFRQLINSINNAGHERRRSDDIGKIRKIMSEIDDKYEKYLP